MTSFSFASCLLDVPRAHWEGGMVCWKGHGAGARVPRSQHAPCSQDSRCLAAPLRGCHPLGLVWKEAFFPRGALAAVCPGLSCKFTGAVLTLNLESPWHVTEESPAQPPTGSMSHSLSSDEGGHARFRTWRFFVNQGVRGSGRKPGPQ